MFVWTNFVLWVAQVLEGALDLYFWIVLAAVVMSWIEPNPYNPIVRAVYAMTEPLFDWIREHLPVLFGGIDFSPLVVVMLISFLSKYLIPTLTQVMVYGFS